MPDQLVFQHPVGPFWRAPAIFFVVFAPMMVRNVVSGSGGAVAGILLLSLSIAALQMFGLAYLFTVRVTDDGITGWGGKGIRWSEIERTAPPTSFGYLGGFVLQSTSKPSAHIPLAIARNEAFQQAVLKRVPSTHPIVRAIAAPKS